MQEDRIEQILKELAKATPKAPTNLIERMVYTIQNLEMEKEKTVPKKKGEQKERLKDPEEMKNNRPPVL